MQTAILAGGMGTRIRAVAGGLPKSLIPVAGRPFIEWQLDLLRRSGLRDVLLCVGVGADAIRAHVGDGTRFGMRVAYAVEDPSALCGTGGALVNARPQLRRSFLVMYGDSYLPTDYAAVCSAFDACPHPGLMCVYRNEGRWDPSNVRVADGRVVFYDKKAPPGTVDCIDYGLSALRRDVIERYRDAALPLDLARILSDLVANSELAAREVTERFYEIGKPEGLRELGALLRDAPKTGRTP